MVILRAIGAFFVKIGRWIKDTAWVQPLLIVGGIFAIIFSIPYISTWVSSWFSSTNEATAFYNSYKVSLSGCQNDTPNSDANKLFDYMANYTPANDKDADHKKWGEKFFVVFVQESCAGCEEIYKGFEVLKNEWGTGTFTAPEGKKNDEFKLYTIFIDSEETINNETKNLFTDYFFNDYDAYFEDIMGIMQENYYSKRAGDTYQSDLKTLDNIDDFATPTVFLFDPNDGDYQTQLGISEVLFTVKGKNGGSGIYPLAYTLYDAWYHQDIFGANYEA